MIFYNLAENVSDFEMSNQNLTALLKQIEQQSLKNATRKVAVY